MAGNRIYEDEIFFERISLHPRCYRLGQAVWVDIRGASAPATRSFVWSQEFCCDVIGLRGGVVGGLPCSLRNAVSHQTGCACVDFIKFSDVSVWLYMVGFKGWCSCLGTLTKQLPVSPETAEAIMLTIAVFLFAGSCYYLLPYVKSRTMSQES